MTLHKVIFQVDRAGHKPGDEVLMTEGAAERLAQRGVVKIVGSVDDTPVRAPEPVTPAPATATPKRRGRPPKVK